MFSPTKVTCQMKGRWNMPIASGQSGITVGVYIVAIIQYMCV